MNEMESDYNVRDIQLVELSILLEIDRLCRENHINYCIVGGTLLGAVRHKGFIPWDDDLDIAMPRKDYERFIQICSMELSDDYYLHSVDSDENYWLPFVKVTKKYTVFEEKNIAGLGCKTGIYVDVFPLDDARKERSKGKSIITKLIKIINSVYLYKIRYYKLHPCDSRKIILYRALGMISTKKLHSLQNRLMKYYNGASTQYYVNYGSNYDTVKQTMPKTVYEPLSEVLFEGHMFYAPADTDYYLRRIYGNDYMELPPLKKRITHNPVKIEYDTRNEGRKNRTMN